MDERPLQVTTLSELLMLRTPWRVEELPAGFMNIEDWYHLNHTLSFKVVKVGGMLGLDASSSILVLAFLELRFWLLDTRKAGTRYQQRKARRNQNCNQC